MSSTYGGSVAGPKLESSDRTIESVLFGGREEDVQQQLRMIMVQLAIGLDKIGSII